jgi:hypothetical protein
VLFFDVLPSAGAARLDCLAGWLRWRVELRDWRRRRSSGSTGVLPKTAQNGSFALSQCVTASLDFDEEAAWTVLVSTLEQGLDAEEELDGRTAAQDLLAHFLCIPDPRQVQWVEHPLAVVLALAAGAVVAGIRSFTAVAGWIEDAPTDLLAWLYVRCQYTVPLGPPSKATVWRLVTGVDADALDLTIGAWLLARATAQRETAPTPMPAPAPDPGTDQADGPGTDPAVRLIPLAVDGKAVRGAKDKDGKQVRLLAAMLHQQRLVLNQVAVGAKTNEVRHEALCRIPGSAGKNSEGGSWAQWLTLRRKPTGTRACHGNLRPCPEIRNGAQGSPRDMAKLRREALCRIPDTVGKNSEERS